MTDEREYWNRARRAISVRNIVELRLLSDELSEMESQDYHGLTPYIQAGTSSLESDFETSIAKCQEVLQAIDEPHGQAFIKAQLLQATVRVELDQPEQALDILKDIEPFLEAEQDKLNHAAMYSCRAHVYHRQGDPAKSMELIHRSIELCRQCNEPMNEAYEIGHLAMIQSELRHHDEALKSLQKGLEIFRKHENMPMVAYTLNSLAGLYGVLGQIEEVVRTCNEALHIAGQVEESRLSSMILIHRATAYTLLGQTDLARTDLDLVRDQDSVVIGSLRWHVVALEGEILEAEGDLEQALTVFQRALSKAESSKLSSAQMSIHEAIANLAKKLKDFDLFLKHNGAHQKLSEKIRGSETARKVALQEKQREIEILENERERERAILYSTLPDHVADRLIKGEQVTDHFENASALFLDIAGFTQISDRIPAGHVVHLLKAIFDVCDAVCKRHGVTRIKTIGDSYMAVSGVPEAYEDHAKRLARTATEMLQELNDLQLTIPPELGDTSWTKQVGEINVRIGLHCGPVVAGVVGDKHLQYDVWGDTVNTASRMESTGESGRIQVSQAFAEAIGVGSSTLVERGEVEVKGKGSMTTYWLESR